MEFWLIMKVIFLDFDGVINSYNNFDNAIDYKCLSILKKIIALTGAKDCYNKVLINILYKEI